MSANTGQHPLHGWPGLCLCLSFCRQDPEADRRVFNIRGHSISAQGGVSPCYMCVVTFSVHAGSVQAVSRAVLVAHPSPGYGITHQLLLRSPALGFPPTSPSLQGVQPFAQDGGCPTSQHSGQTFSPLDRQKTTIFEGYYHLGNIRIFWTFFKPFYWIIINVCLFNQYLGQKPKQCSC